MKKKAAAQAAFFIQRYSRTSGRSFLPVDYRHGLLYEDAYLGFIHRPQ